MSISERINQFRDLCGYPFTTIEIATQRHVESKKIYDLLVQRLMDIKRPVHERAQRSDILPQTLLDIDGELTTLSAIWRTFNNTLLTEFPHAQIDYGAPLVLPLTPWTVREQIPDLCSRFPQYRQVCGDGNCFYTSFAVGYLSWACADAQKFQMALSNLLEDAIAGVNMPDFEGKKEAIDTFTTLAANPSQLENILLNNQKMLPIVSYLRHRAAFFILQSKEMHAFLNGTARTYAIDRVLQMGHEAEHQEILALCKALKVPIQIFDLQRSGSRELHMGDGSPLFPLLHSGDHYKYLSTDPVPNGGTKSA